MTHARVALGRVGAALPTRALLDFQLDHARARDAVHTPLGGGFADTISGALVVQSRARDRPEYLRRPDLGRALDEQDRERLQMAAVALPRDRTPGIAIVVADGLSATAVHAHGGAMVAALRDRLASWRIAPVVVARLARVAIGDAIGAALGVDLVVVLIGERPGLSAPDSLGAYLTWQPRPGRRDEERNCVSNIRPPHGLGYDVAADTICWIVAAARLAGRTGVTVKDGTERTAAITPGSDPDRAPGSLPRPRLP